jgi:outer membrane lipoprotein-sorting protein
MASDSGIVIKSIKIFIIIIFSALFIGWGDTWDQIKNSSKDITSVEADFVQKKYLEILAKPLVSKGKFYFQTPKSLRWEYLSPVQSILMMHGGAMKRYIKKGDTVIQDASVSMQSMQIILGEITFWMKGDYDKNPSFTPELKQGRIITLTPKDKSLADIIQRIELKLSNTSGVIRYVKIYESKKSYTVIDFNRVKLNAQLPDSLFLEL